MDRPTLDELLEAVSEFVEREILPTLQDPRLRFQTLVALNALGIARRELTLGEALKGEDRQALVSLLGVEAPLEELLRLLAERIRRGEAPPGTEAFLKAHVARKLTVANPKYLERYP
ncbi:hypothetical protein TJA_21010 [Thermus sp. LT1-2-5]|uniref:DUF6285 domain-containing protein n=1 Tax=Thermus sp. LT1-2-5 TaxID=3026935 RepID=UPI0030E98528